MPEATTQRHAPVTGRGGADAQAADTTAAAAADESQLLAGVIHHPRLVLVRGEGAFVWDVQGRRYLDFTSGLAVAALGHGRRDLADVLAAQFATLGHCSNLYGNLPALELARRLCDSSFATRVWFANSGTEANEAALKFARLHARAAGGARKNRLVAFKGGFHGRTLGALAVTYHPAYRTPFAPLAPGVRFAPFGDTAALRGVIDDRTAAVIVEPVLGEGGVVPASPEFLRALRERCDAHDALLIFDEVQCGLGRIGSLYAYQSYGVVPDMVTLAKPLAAGLPLGAVLIGPRPAAHLKPGHHGSTFSGGPATCAVAVRVFDAVAQPEFLAAVRARGDRLRAGLESLAARSRVFAGARGLGLMQALVLAPAWKKRGGEFTTAARTRGLLVTRAGDDAIRLLPPLVVTDAEIDAALELLAAAAADLAPRPRAAPAAAKLDTTGGRR
jgi:predicted acetylornithine/succinylornithine family transaminase